MGAKKILCFLLLFSMALTGIAISGNTYDYQAYCPKNGGKMVIDKWSFYQCECTSYAADKLNEKGVKFYNYYKGTKWGWASNWVNAAKSAGISYNTTPKRGDVAWFSYGHVAFVESVDSKQNITISEYNYSSYKYTTRTISRTASSYPRYFIHL
jgi:surface antigen